MQFVVDHDRVDGLVQHGRSEPVAVGVGPLGGLKADGQVAATGHGEAGSFQGQRCSLFPGYVLGDRQEDEFAQSANPPAWLDPRRKRQDRDGLRKAVPQRPVEERDHLLAFEVGQQIHLGQDHDYTGSDLARFGHESSVLLRQRPLRADRHQGRRRVRHPGARGFGVVSQDAAQPWRVHQPQPRQIDHRRSQQVHDGDLPPVAGVARFGHELGEPSRIDRLDRAVQPSHSNRLCTKTAQNGKLGGMGSCLSSPDSRFFEFLCKARSGQRRPGHHRVRGRPQVSPQRSQGPATGAVNR